MDFTDPAEPVRDRLLRSRPAERRAALHGRVLVGLLVQRPHLRRRDLARHRRLPTRSRASTSPRPRSSAAELGDVRSVQRAAAAARHVAGRACRWRGVPGPDGAGEPHPERARDQQVESVLRGSASAARMAAVAADLEADVRAIRAGARRRRGQVGEPRGGVAGAGCAAAVARGGGAPTGAPAAWEDRGAEAGSRARPLGRSTVGLPSPRTRTGSSWP